MDPQCPRTFSLKYSMIFMTECLGSEESHLRQFFWENSLLFSFSLQPEDLCCTCFCHPYFDYGRYVAANLLILHEACCDQRTLCHSNMLIPGSLLFSLCPLPGEQKVLIKMSRLSNLSHGNLL